MDGKLVDQQLRCGVGFTGEEGIYGMNISHNIPRLVGN